VKLSSISAVPFLRLAVLATLAVATGACGSSSGASPAAPEDAGIDASTDTGAVDAADAADSATTGDAEAGAAYPAFAVDYPQVQKNQGTVLEKPVVVTVTWPALDTSTATWEGFGDAIGASSYWAATTSQYGVGPVTSGPANHVHMTQPLPASLSYTDLQAFVITAVTAAEADGGVPSTGDAGAPDPAWPAPTFDASGNSQTIYSLFIPGSTSVTDPGTGTAFCVEGGLGYHDDVIVGSAPVAYAVTLECSGQTTADLEETAAHETIEASTNPFPESSSLGYVGFDADHLAWDLYTGFNDELSDACQNWQDSYYEESGSFPYWVQRSWSNSAALLGHDPCAPAAAGAYQGMTLIPSEESTVSLDLSVIGATTASSRGFNVTMGQPLTFHVGFFSDAPSGPWTIAYDFPASLATYDTSFNPLGNGTATVTLDKTSGQNGDEVTVTVTPTAKGEGSFQVMVITWAPPSDTMEYLPHYLPILLVDN
jgi:hypothetical protein